MTAGRPTRLTVHSTEIKKSVLEVKGEGRVLVDKFANPRHLFDPNKTRWDYAFSR